MPSKERNRKSKQRIADPSLKNSWECPDCHKLYSRLKNGPKKHEASCPKWAEVQAQKAKNIPARIVPAMQELSDSSYLTSDSDEELWPDKVQVRSHGVHSRPQTPPNNHSPLPSRPPSETPDDHETPTDMPSTLGETEVWIKRHPASGLPSGYATQSPQNNATSQDSQALLKLPPFFPLRTYADFLQAEIFSQNNCSDNHINDQLRMLHATHAYSNLPQSERLTLKDAADYHATLARAAGVSDKFAPHDVVTSFKGRDYVHSVKFRPVFPALSSIVRDPELFEHFALHPEQPFIRRSEQDPTPMRFWEELQHGDDWWQMQDSIPDSRSILFLCVYIDETNVSTIGGVDVWPVYMWVGNLPGSIRRQRNKKGGAILIGYLPEASKGDIPLSDADLAELRVCVYHDALAFMFESLKIPARHGTPMRCENGKIRIFHPTIGVISADYKELCRIVCILGSKSGFTCPICLVPREEQHNLLDSWEPRTVEDSQALVAEAEDATTLKQQDEILHRQSLRCTRNIFHNIMPSFFSVYAAISADPLHQIEQGVFGKHIWPWICKQLSPKSATILDTCFKSIPRYPDLKHFPNSITTLKNVTGAEHAVILHLLPPLLEDLIPLKIRRIVITVLRSLAKIHMYAKFTTHTERTLEDLQQEIVWFGGAYADLAQLDESIATNYPKFHSLSHLVDIIQRKSTTDNYHTGLGEALHPQSKKDYRRTNHQETYKEQMLRTYQERELMIRIRALMDQQNSTDNHDSYRPVPSKSPTDRIEFDRHPIKMLTSTFVRERFSSDPEAKHFVRDLRTFLYQEVGGFGNSFHFRAQMLPHLDGTSVAIHKLLRIAYVSLVDSRDGLDVTRVTESWHNKGPRWDFVLYDGKHGLSVAQLLAVFTFKMLGKSIQIAYIQHFRVLRRNKMTGCIELKDESVRNFIFIDSIIRSCVVLSPEIRPGIAVLHDLEGADMYL
ncbi:hypothetical protein FS749_003534 [Ceratobasidium sp. UAMH 11750]|nr:hypothetical protein FS749_003534 [Ceratobasidium sp. UAMH 11750]